MGGAQARLTGSPSAQAEWAARVQRWGGAAAVQTTDTGSSAATAHGSSKKGSGPRMPTDGSALGAHEPEPSRPWGGVGCTSSPCAGTCEVAVVRALLHRLLHQQVAHLCVRPGRGQHHLQRGRGTQGCAAQGARAGCSVAHLRTVCSRCAGLPYRSCRRRGRGALCVCRGARTRVPVHQGSRGVGCPHA